MRVGQLSLAVFGLVLVLTGCDALTTPQHRLARARAELDAGQLGRAEIDLRKLVQGDPHNAEGWVLLAGLSLDLNAPNAALADLDRAVAAGAKDTELDTLRARAWLATGQAQTLINALTHHELSSIAEPERTVELSRAYLSLRQTQQAEALLTPLLEAHPELIDAHLTLARALTIDGKLDGALAQLDRALASNPHLAPALAQRADLLQRQGHQAAAESGFKSALQNMSARTRPADRVIALMGLTEARLALGENQLAASSQALLVKLAPSAPYTQMLGARLKLAQGDTRGAISDLQQAVSRDPNFAQGQLLLGTAELKQGNLEQAGQALQQAVQLNPQNVEARELLASIQLQLNQPEQALRTLTPAMSARPADPQLLSLLGAVESRSGKPDVVLQSLEADAQAHPQDRNMRLNLAEAYLFSGRAPQALTLIETTPEVAGDARQEGLKVVALNLLQGSKAATTQIEKLLATHPRDIAILDLSAAFYTAQQQPTRAHELLEQSLALDGRNVKTLVTLSQADAAQGDLSSAEGSLRKALALDSNNSQIRLALTNLLISRGAFADADAVLAPINGPGAGAMVQFELAHLALARGDLKQGNSALDRAIAQQPQDAGLVSQAGEMLMQAGHYDAALVRFTAASQLAPNNAVYWLAKGRAQLALNQTASARESFQKAAQLRAQWLPAVSALVLLDLQAKDFQRALNRVNEVLTSRPEDIEALVLRGDVEWAMGDFKTSEATYTQAQERRPNAAVVAKVFRARLGAHESNPEQPLVQWLTLSPHDLAIRSVLGTYYLSEHALQQSAGEFQAILEQVPDDVLALNDLAWVYSELKNPRAETLAQRAHQLAPAQPNVDDTYGWILAREGKNREALPLLAQAAKLDSTDPDVQYHYAYALVQEGRRTEAHQILSNLLSDGREFASRHDAERLLADTKS